MTFGYTENTMSGSLAITPVILCGGAGSRLWPMSRDEKPKQFHRFVNDKTLLTNTLERVGFAGEGLSYLPTRIVGGVKFEALLVEQGETSSAEVERYIVEPSIRDTAAAIAAAIADLAETDPDRMVLVLPSDHDIPDNAEFHAVIRSAAGALAVRGGIMTIGIAPTRPETQYGYIERGDGPGPVYDVLRFREKPDLETAEAFLQSGRFFWNGGIFLFRAGEMGAEIARQQPEVWRHAVQSVTRAEVAGKVWRLDAQAFAASPKISIDFAVMENAPRIGVVAASFAWNDLGSWNQLHECSPLDPHGNARFGDVVTIDVKNSYLRSEDRLLAVAGLEDIIVVSQPDALLIVHRDQAHLVKDITQMVKAAADWPPLAVAHSGRPVPSPRVIHKWLFDVALPFWADKGLDRAHGGVFEALNHDGSPADLGFKRLRVLARQIYCFAHASTIGWQGESDAVLRHCFDTLTSTGWHAEGGWIHRFHPDGTVQDAQRDTYDQCFVLLALAWLWRAKKWPEAREWAERTIAFMDAELADTVHGGFFESDRPTGFRRANPHMHYLEAMQAWYEATRETRFLDRAQAAVDLFTDRFFDAGSWTVTEYFGLDWSVCTDRAPMVEPGHHYEWIWLLLRHARLADQPALREYCRKLYATSHAFGHARGTDAVCDAMAPDGSSMIGTARLWPQTEALKAGLEARAQGLPGDETLFIRMLDVIFNRYLTVPTAGGWYDQIDPRGRVISKDMPTSTFYHVFCGLVEYLKSEGMLADQA
ncbi:mannose-1-phosphate guanylyltransferase/mannose-6-phosphate isomerase [Hoeflea marina]|uniref:Mannose-1-phosphate guanylyltransferase/mannose-6-phosphate isomerase n=1 Tax=Hoeflea marina TaxID=274592 RepID=A0A317PIP3_9HYPH|nr:AGE family epimerase/isomerase [Hoeflea marina]PWW00323.1 mannose-1-phosphate guanylyltransferase/mannose-6-phosphate isomerase [Hoeflea marina]